MTGWHASHHIVVKYTYHLYNGNKGRVQRVSGTTQDNLTISEARTTPVHPASHRFIQPATLCNARISSSQLRTNDRCVLGMVRAAYERGFELTLMDFPGFVDSCPLDEGVLRCGGNSTSEYPDHKSGNSGPSGFSPHRQTYAAL